MTIHLEGRREELESIWQENLQKNGDDPYKSLEISIKALEEYPYDESFLFRAAIAEEWLADAETDDISKNKHLHKAMNYAQRLLKENPNEETAKELIVKIYSKLGLEDMAIEQAYKCQNVDLALKFCLKGDSLRRHRQQIISKKLLDLLYEMSQADFYMLDISEKIVNLVIPDGNYQYFYHILEGVYLKRAGMYLQSGDEESAIETLKKLFEITKLRPHVLPSVLQAEKTYLQPAGQCRRCIRLACRSAASRREEPACYLADNSSAAAPTRR